MRKCIVCNEEILWEGFEEHCSFGCVDITQEKISKQWKKTHGGDEKE
jgi:hypothetical protein